eukprot:TRINITY_DN182_c0_g1_i2.p1 TRINITY_DN182_c0_g1~~TRINITY_DN182_c0_g1_i2.p1  ORF type:complete len:253 (-),score=53.23 TRINITY_DN182_c0_g1_i2:9-767(-)
MATTQNRAQSQNNNGDGSKGGAGAPKKNAGSPYPQRFDNRGGSRGGNTRSNSKSSPNMRPNNSPNQSRSPGRVPYRRWSPVEYDSIMAVKKQAPSFSENEIFQLLVEKKFNVQAVISALQDKKKTFWSNIVKEGILPTDAPVTTSPPNGSVNDNIKNKNQNTAKSNQTTKKRNPNNNNNNNNNTNNSSKSRPDSSKPSSSPSKSNNVIATESTSVPVKAQPPKDKLTLFEEALMSVEPVSYTHLTLPTKRIV